MLLLRRVTCLFLCIPHRSFKLPLSPLRNFLPFPSRCSLLFFAVHDERAGLLVSHPLLAAQPAAPTCSALAECLREARDSPLLSFVCVQCNAFAGREVNSPRDYSREALLHVLVLPLTSHLSPCQGLSKLACAFGQALEHPARFQPLRPDRRPLTARMHLLLRFSWASHRHPLLRLPSFRRHQLWPRRVSRRSSTAGRASPTEQALALQVLRELVERQEDYRPI